MRYGILFCLLLIAVDFAEAAPGDIVFVTQVPQPFDFATIGSTFANHSGSEDSAPRGGDLYIRYADGSLKNLTKAAGFGVEGFQGASSIAVRDPSVHWSGEKVIFSMVIGSAAQRYQYNTYFWQLYEISGLGKNQTPSISKVPNQPEDYNNVMPTYGTDDRIFFSSDRPRNGARHLYPQRDEYESTRTNSGLWRLTPSSGDLVLLDHAPSGIFNPIIDSFGRVIYTRWDHLQRDQQAANRDDYGAFNYANETENAARITQTEYFPEQRGESERTDPNLNLHTINQFFPWMINEDGTEHETLNHVGRHELHGYINRSFNNDGNLEEYYGQYSRTNPNSILNFFQIREDPLSPGSFYGIDAPEFQTHSAGQVVKLNGAPSARADQMIVTYVTHRATAGTSAGGNANHSGLYRNPLPLTTGTLVAAHTNETREDRNDGTRNNPLSRYQFRLKTLKVQGAVQVSDQTLTSGIVKSISYWDPDELVSYNGPLWELQPVELVPRSRPASHRGQMENPELTVFQQEGVDVTELKEYMRQNALALIVTRNMTSRDAQDLQQPFNLRVAGTNTQKIPLSGKIYDISHLQIFQGDYLRGYDGADSPSAGRRILAVPMHSALWANITNAGGPQSSVKIAADGSSAAFVPARRALSWQVTAPDNSAVVRERYWLTFQPGEIRVCASCHGLNHHDQTGAGVPQNAPEALREVLRFWRDHRPTPPENPEDPPSPPDPPPPPPVNDNPQYMVAFSSTKKRTVVPNELRSGWKGAVFVGGMNGSAANKTIQLNMFVEGAACPAAVEERMTNADGNILVQGSVPSAKRNITLSFQAVYNGTVVGSSNVVLSNGKRKQKPGALKAKDISKLCKSFAKFR